MIPLLSLFKILISGSSWISTLILMVFKVGIEIAFVLTAECVGAPFHCHPRGVPVASPSPQSCLGRPLRAGLCSQASLTGRIKKTREKKPHSDAGARVAQRTHEDGCSRRRAGLRVRKLQGAHGYNPEEGPRPWRVLGPDAGLLRAARPHSLLCLSWSLRSCPIFTPGPGSGVSKPFPRGVTISHYLPLLLLHGDKTPRAYGKRVFPFLWDSPQPPSDSPCPSFSPGGLLR